MFNIENLSKNFTNWIVQNISRYQRISRMNQNCFIFIKQHKNFNMLNFLKSEMKNEKQNLKTDDSLFKKIKRFLESKN
jgi:hypothetical protein